MIAMVIMWGFLKTHGISLSLCPQPPPPPLSISPLTEVTGCVGSTLTISPCVLCSVMFLLHSLLPNQKVPSLILFLLSFHWNEQWTFTKELLRLKSNVCKDTWNGFSVVGPWLNQQYKVLDLRFTCLSLKNLPSLVLTSFVNPSIQNWCLCLMVL